MTYRFMQEKRDASIARNLQRQEMAGVIDISDAFLQELRLNEEFNKILAKGTLTE